MIEGKHKIGCGANLQYYSPKKTEVKNINDYNVLPLLCCAKLEIVFFLKQWSTLNCNCNVCVCYFIAHLNPITIPVESATIFSPLTEEPRPKSKPRSRTSGSCFWERQVPWKPRKLFRNSSEQSKRIILNSEETFFWHKNSQIRSTISSQSIFWANLDIRLRRLRSDCRKRDGRGERHL